MEQAEIPLYKRPSWYIKNVEGYKEKTHQWNKESLERKMANDPDFKNKRNARNKERYENDPEYRQRRIQSVKRCYQKKKALKDGVV
jgi:hypothetical protein